MRNAEFEEKYKIGEAVSTSDCYIAGKGWDICDDGRIYLTDINDEYGYLFSLPYSDELKKEFKAVADVADELRILERAHDYPENYGFLETDIKYSPSHDYVEIDFEIYDENGITAIRVDGYGGWCAVNRIPERVFFSAESPEYLFDEDYNYIDLDGEIDIDE